MTNKNVFKIPVCAAILTKLPENELQACCVPCSACTVHSTTTVSFCEWDFFPFIPKLSQHNKKEEEFDKGTGQDRSGCKKAPQGTNLYHTIKYNLD